MAFCGAGVGYKNAPAPKRTRPAPNKFIPAPRRTNIAGSLRYGAGVMENEASAAVFGAGATINGAGGSGKWEWSVFLSETIPGDIAPEPTPWHFHGYGPPTQNQTVPGKRRPFPRTGITVPKTHKPFPENWQTFHAQEADHPHKKSSNLRVGVAAEKNRYRIAQITILIVDNSN